MKKCVIILSVVCAILAAACAWQARELARRGQQMAKGKIALEREQQARADQESAAQYVQRREREWKDKAMQLSALVGTLRASQAAQSSNAMPFAQTANANIPGQGQTNEASGGMGGMFGKGMGTMIAQMMKDPSMRELMRSQQKVALKQMYGSLIADLKLPPEQEQKLNDLLLEQHMQTIERSQDMFSAEGADLQKIAEASKETEKKNDAAIEELLGPEKFAEFQDYKKTMADRMQLGQFKTQLQEMGHSLRDDQAKQMLAVMREERERYPMASDPKGNRKLEGMFDAEAMERHFQWQEEVNQRTQERLAPILTPEQLKAYVAMQEQQLSMQKFGAKMAREMFGKGDAGSLPGPGPGAAPTVVK